MQTNQLVDLNNFEVARDIFSIWVYNNFERVHTSRTPQCVLLDNIATRHRNHF